jgi:hypothetical protein
MTPAAAPVQAVGYPAPELLWLNNLDYLSTALFRGSGSYPLEHSPKSMLAGGFLKEDKQA